MKILDIFDIKKHIAPLSASTEKNTEALHALAYQMAGQFAQTQNELRAFSEQTQKSLKELSMQTEEVYDCVSGSDPSAGSVADPVTENDVHLLVGTAIALRDNIEHLREYSLVRNDEDLLRQVDLLTQVCDRHLCEAGIRKIGREGEPYNARMDIVTDVAHEPDAPPNQNLKALSGCYQYQGEIIKRASVIVNKAVIVNGNTPADENDMIKEEVNYE